MAEPPARLSPLVRGIEESGRRGHPLRHSEGDCEACGGFPFLGASARSRSGSHRLRCAEPAPALRRHWAQRPATAEPLSPRHPKKAPAGIAVPLSLCAGGVPVPYLSPSEAEPSGRGAPNIYAVMCAYLCGCGVCIYAFLSVYVYIML